MKEMKRLILRIFLIVEVAGLTGWYIVGKSGLRAIRGAERYNKQLDTDINNLEKEIGMLKEELEERQKNPFYKEKIARQELQMAREDEEIYLLPDSIKDF